MKKIVVLLGFLLCTYYSCYSQLYRTLFDRLDQEYFNGDNPSFISNYYYHILHNDASTIMESYIVMYKATGDKKYLDKFIVYAKRIQELRDDNILSIPYVQGIPNPGSTSCGAFTQIDPTSIAGKKGWSAIVAGCNSDALYMESGTICYSMAEFIYLMRTNSSLNNEPVPKEANSVQAPSTVYASNTITNYLQFADWLENRIHETISFHVDNDWNGNYFDNPNTFDALNMECAIGRLIALMYQISVVEGNPIIDYLTITERIATIVYKHLKETRIGALPTVPEPDGWYAWCHKVDCGDNLWEDISHAWLEMEFVDLCSRFGIQASNGYNFSSVDMKKFANGFAHRIVANPLDLRMNVYGTNCNCNQMCCFCDVPAGAPSDCGDGSAPAHPFYNRFQLFGYTFLTQYHPDIYQIISDFYTPSDFSNPFNSSTMPFVPAQQMKAYADLLLYENLFNPLSVNRNTFPDNQWAGTAGGDFDGDGTQEFVTARNKLGSEAIEIFALDANSTISQRTSIVNHSYPLWAGVTATDIDVSHAGDEIAAISNNDQSIYLYAQNGSAISQFGGLTVGISGWTGIAAGNFDGITGNEIILSNSNGRVYVYRYNGTSLVADNINTGSNFINSNLAGITVGDFDGNPGDEFATINNSPSGNIEITVYSFASSTLTQLSIFTLATGNYSQWNGITSGDFDGDGIDEIIAHRNYDGDFFIFKLDASAQVVNNYKEHFPVNQLNGVIGSARFSIDQSKDALISLRNFDGNMFIYNLEGLCPGLNLTTPITAATSIDNTYQSINNNYPIDYHVNNTIVASNTIASPSIVDMSSGKEIIFKPGFSASAGSDLHAYIAPALECNPATFRRSVPPNIVNQPQPISEVKKIKTIVNANIGITPNPNTGSFQIAVTRNEKPVAIKEIKVYDMMGKIIWENGPSTTNIFNVNITSYAQGIYYVKCINEFDEMEIKKLIKQ